MTLARISPNLQFSAAAALWLESRSFHATAGSISARYIRESTERSYRAYVDSLNLFFGQLPLEKIHLGHLRQYQEARVTGAAPFIRYRRPQDAKARTLPDGTILPPKGKQPCPASAKKANQELCILKMILRRAGCWSEEMDEFYERYNEDESDVPRALTVDQQHRWLDVSRIHERWWTVHWYSHLAFGTGMGTNEMRSLRIGDLNLHQQIVSVPPAGAKNRYRARTIPLVSAETRWAAEQLLRRAADLGAASPQHYLFPWYSRHKWDPCRPMTVSGIKRAWEEVRAASGLSFFTPYHTRHTALTRWAEGGMQIATLMALAGHMTVRMMRHYARISDGVKRREMEAAMGTAPKFGPRPELGEWAQSSPFYLAKRA